MALISCPECKSEVSSTAEVCPKCGYNIKKYIEKSKPLVRWPFVAKTIGGFFAVIFLLAILSSIFNSNDSDSGSSRSSSSSPSTVKPQSPAERLKYEVKQALGTSNRGKARVIGFRFTTEYVQIDFSINDNLTSGMIKTSAKIDITIILKAVTRSGYDYMNIVVIGSFPLTDKLGNSKETRVVEAKYAHSTIDKINWQGFLFDDVYDIAEYVWLHPTFQ